MRKITLITALIGAVILSTFSFASNVLVANYKGQKITTNQVLAFNSINSPYLLPEISGSSVYSYTQCVVMADMYSGNIAKDSNYSKVLQTFQPIIQTAMVERYVLLPTQKPTQKYYQNLFKKYQSNYTTPPYYNVTYIVTKDMSGASLAKNLLATNGDVVNFISGNSLVVSGSSYISQWKGDSNISNLKLQQALSMVTSGGAILGPQINNDGTYSVIKVNQYQAPMALTMEQAGQPFMNFANNYYVNAYGEAIVKSVFEKNVKWNQAFLAKIKSGEVPQDITMPIFTFQGKTYTISDLLKTEYKNSLPMTLLSNLQDSQELNASAMRLVYPQIESILFKKNNLNKGSNYQMYENVAKVVTLAKIMFLEQYYTPAVATPQEVADVISANAQNLTSLSQTDKEGAATNYIKTQKALKSCGEAVHNGMQAVVWNQPFLTRNKIDISKYSQIQSN